MKALCAEVGFHLTKFVSNSKYVLSMPEGDRRKGLHDQELRLGTLPTEKALDINWHIKEDKLGFCINFKEKPSTKHGMLSMVNSIYDSLEVVSPFLLECRLSYKCCVTINLLEMILYIKVSTRSGRNRSIT